MEKLKEPKYYQIYELHMKNGEVLRVAEDYDIPAKDGLIGIFKRKEVEFLEYTDILHGYTVPIDQIPPIPNPQSPIPNPQSPIKINKI